MLPFRRAVARRKVPVIWGTLNHSKEIVVPRVPRLRAISLIVQYVSPAFSGKVDSW